MKLPYSVLRPLTIGDFDEFCMQLEYNCSPSEVYLKINNKFFNRLQKVILKKPISGSRIKVSGNGITLYFTYWSIKFKVEEYQKEARYLTKKVPNI